jgi:hypothetical protein
VIRGRVLQFVFLCGLLPFALPAYGNLIINPVFESGITSDPNAAVIEATINSTVSFYEATFSNNFTISIGFDEFGGLGASASYNAIFPYSLFIADLHAASSGDATDTTALSLLPIGSTNPADGSSSVFINWANLKALGVAVGPTPDHCGGSGGTDFAGCILLNPNFTTPPNAPGGSAISLASVTEHEIDEVLGLGSGLRCSGSGAANCSTFTAFPEDLFRYTAGGARTYSLNPQTDLACAGAPTAFFSIDGTNDLAQFNNCDNIGDYGDWASVSGNPAQVQDAFSMAGDSPTLNRTSPEIVALDALGYNLTANAPEPASIVLCGLGLVTAACFARLRRYRCEQDR